jgi:hypothetical protein
VSGFKVGDVIEGEDAYAALPIGTVLQTGAGGEAGLFRTNAGFTDAWGNTYGPRQLAWPRTVLFLPSLPLKVGDIIDGRKVNAEEWPAGSALFSLTSGAVYLRRQDDWASSRTRRPITDLAAEASLFRVICLSTP